MSPDLPLDELDGDDNDDYTMISKTRSFSFGPQTSLSGDEQLDSQEPVEGAPIDLGSIISIDEEQDKDASGRTVDEFPDEPAVVDEFPDEPASVDLGSIISTDKEEDEDTSSRTTSTSLPGASEETDVSSHFELTVQAVDEFPDEPAMVDEFPDEPAYDNSPVFGMGRSDMKDSSTGNSDPERVPDDESNESQNSSDKKLEPVPVYDFWHNGFKDHTFHLGKSKDITNFYYELKTITKKFCK